MLLLLYELRLTQQVAGIHGKKKRIRLDFFSRRVSGSGFYWLLSKTPELRLGCRFWAKPDHPTAAKLFFSGNKPHMLQMALLQGAIDTD